MNYYFPFSRIDRSKAFDDCEVGQPPLLQHLMKFKDRVIVSLLEQHAEWVGDLKQVSKDQALWLYALLGLIEKPLNGEDISTIRSVAKTAREYRTTLLEENSSQQVTTTVHLDLIICIVANYFGQKDLSD